MLRAKHFNLHVLSLISNLLILEEAVLCAEIWLAEKAGG